MAKLPRKERRFVPPLTGMNLFSIKFSTEPDGKERNYGIAAYTRKEAVKMLREEFAIRKIKTIKFVELILVQEVPV